MTKIFQHLVSALAIAVAAFGPATAMADPTFPARPVRLIVPYGAGGTTDVLARHLAQKLSTAWGQQVLVDNRPGGGTVIGATAVARAPADGYTLLFTTNSQLINPHLMPLPYDTFKDFTPITGVGTSPYLVLVPGSSKANSLKELVENARANPGKVNFGSGIGGLTHLAGELLNVSAGTKIEMIHYKGGAALANAGLAGEIDFFLDPPATNLQHIQAGKLRAIAITGPLRLPLLPQVPTVSESGFADFDVTIAFLLYGPANLPKGIVDRIDEQIRTSLREPDMVDRFNALGLVPFSPGLAGHAQWLRDQHDRFGRIVRQANIKAE